MTQADFEAGNVGGLFQAKELEEWERNLQRDVEAWNNQLDMMQTGTLNTRQEMTMLNQTPLVLQMVGAKNLPVKIAPGKLKRAIKKHNLPIDVVKQIPASLTDPVLVLKSAIHEGDLLMMLELKDSANEGATINVPIALELKDATGYEANIATTVFGRRDKFGKPDNQWFVSQARDGNLVYRNNKKIRDWARTSKVQFLGANSRTINGKQKIFTEADLVNLRNANPGMYQNGTFAARGAMSTLPDGRHFVALFENQDASTVLHETAHYFMEQLREAHALANSMLNMSFGAIMGGVMHAGGGTFAEWRRARSGKAQPWEYVPVDDDSQALMQAHADEIARFRQEANPNADPELIRQSALADASLFDSHARNWAYHERKTVGEYYQQNRPEYRSWQPDFERMDDAGGFEWREDGGAPELPQGDTLYHAMYRNKAETIDEFLGKYDQLIQNKTDTYFDFQQRQINRQDGFANGYEVWLGINQVKHIKARHPDFRRWDKIPDVIENGKRQFLGRNKVSGGGPTYLFTLKDGDKSIAVIGAPVESKNRGNRVVVLTAFRDSEKGIQNWVRRFFNNKDAASSQGSGGSPANPSPQRGDLLGSENGNTNILNQSGPVNRSIVGRQTQILGANSKEIGRYEVREMDDVIASHDPENQFRRRENYPQEAQEQPYHSDEGEQQKVVGNALNYEPAFVVSTDASATNGPPIITQNGIVLGGNSRTMTLQMVYGQQPEKAAAYRQTFVDNASQFGIDPNAIANMKRPMLVRVVSGQFSPEDMAKRSREYNQTTTQQLQGEAEGISRARFVDRPTRAVDIFIEKML